MLPERLKRPARTFLLLAALGVPPALLTFLPAALSASQPLVDTGLHLKAVRFDGLGRLVAFPDKETIPCPAQTARTAVLLVAGRPQASPRSHHDCPGIEYGEHDTDPGHDPGPVARPDLPQVRRGRCHSPPNRGAP